jgi:hypothetical protein
MHIDDATPASPDSEYLWLRDGDLPRTREDRVAEGVALVALLFSLGIGLMIAMLPVSVSTTVAVETSLEPSHGGFVATHDEH